MRGRLDNRLVRTIVCGAFVVAAILCALFFRLPLHPVLDTGRSEFPVGPIARGTAFVQELHLHGQLQIDSVEVLLATWSKPTNSTHDMIRVFAGDGRLLAAKDLPPGTVEDNSYVRVSFPHPIDLTGARRFFVSVSSRDGSRTQAHSITAWATTPAKAGQRLYRVSSERLQDPSSVPTVGRLQRGALCLRVVGTGPGRVMAGTFLRVLGTIVFLVLAALIWWWAPLRRWWNETRRLAWLRGRLRREPIAWLYLVVALIWGLSMIAITPPFQVPDEDAHYYRAWSVAELQLVAGPHMIVTLPANVATLPARIGSGVGRDWPHNSYSLEKARSLLWEKIDGRTTPVRTGAASYGPIGYIPQAVGISIARALGHSPLLGLYLGRILNLLATAILVFFAIRAVPFGKSLVALVALLPMFVFEAGSLSVDGLALSGALLFLALVLRLRSSESVRTTDLVLLGLAAALLLNTKAGFAVLVFLIFAVPPRRFGGTRRYVAWVCSILAVTFGLAALLMFTAPNQLIAVPAGVDQARQLSFVLHHPWAFVKVLAATLNHVSLGNTDLTYVPASLPEETYGFLGWLTVRLPAIGFYAMVTAAVLLLGYRETISLTWWSRTVMAVTAVLFSIGAALALYLGWSPVGASVVGGLQGRYIIPALALGLFTIYGIRPARQRAVVLILLVAVAIAALTTLAALVRFYY